MRKPLNTKRFDDLLNLEHLKSRHSGSYISIEYSTGTKLPKSFGISDSFYIKEVILGPISLTISLREDINLLTNERINLRYNISKSQYVKFKIFVI